MRKCLTDRRLSYNVTPEELFDLFGKFGPVRCVNITNVFLDSLGRGRALC